jgi:hypothetical protein
VIAGMKKMTEDGKMALMMKDEELVERETENDP